MSDKMREEFEAWWVQSGHLVIKELDGEYSFQQARYAWQAWQASRAAMEQEGWKLVPVDPTKEMMEAMQESGWYKECYSKMLSLAPKP